MYHATSKAVHSFESICEDAKTTIGKIRSSAIRIYRKKDDTVLLIGQGDVLWNLDVEHGKGCLSPEVGRLMSSGPGKIEQITAYWQYFYELASDGN